MKPFTLLFSLLLVASSSFDFLTAQRTACLEAQNRKSTPTRQDGLIDMCKSWSELSCCVPNDYNFHMSNATWLGFNYNHCGPLSESCKRRFMKEICLYECDPYLSTWFVNDTSKSFRKQRLYQLPLCKKDCDAWFDDCKSSYTCRDNWSKGFKWLNGVNYCPEHEKCETFEQKFKTAKNFCSKIWDESFTVVDDPQNCISFEFQETSNPNQKAAKFYEDLFSSSTNPQSGASWIFALLLTSLYFAL